MADELDHAARGVAEPGEPFSIFERICAIVPGMALSTFGTIAVFKTSNQAGSVALLVVGTILTLVGINGAPLLSAKFKDAEIHTVAVHRKRAIARAISESPSDARHTIQVLTSLDPQAQLDPRVGRVAADAYEADVCGVVKALLPTGATEPPLRNDRADLVINFTGKRIAVWTKYSFFGSLRLDALRKWVDWLEGSNFEGGIYISNGEGVNPDTAETISAILGGSSKKVEFVRWAGASDNGALMSAIESVQRALG